MACICTALLFFLRGFMFCVLLNFCVDCICLLWRIFLYSVCSFCQFVVRLFCVFFAMRLVIFV